MMFNQVSAQWQQLSDAKKLWLIGFVIFYVIYQSTQFYSEKILNIQYLQVTSGGSSKSTALHKEVNIKEIPYLESKLADVNISKSASNGDLNGDLFAIAPLPVVKEPVEVVEAPKLVVKTEKGLSIARAVRQQFKVTLVEDAGAVINRRFYLVGEKMPLKVTVEGTPEVVKLQSVGSRFVVLSVNETKVRIEVRT